MNFIINYSALMFKKKTNKAHLFYSSAKMALIGWRQREADSHISFLGVFSLWPDDFILFKSLQKSKINKKPNTARVLSHLNSYFLWNRGGRFSIRAVRASKKSSLPKAWFNPRFSWSRAAVISAIRGW
jgi:hypothetical protein